MSPRRQILHNLCVRGMEVERGPRRPVRGTSPPGAPSWSSDIQCMTWTHLVTWDKLVALGLNAALPRVPAVDLALLGGRSLGREG